MPKRANQNSRPVRVKALYEYYKTEMQIPRADMRKLVTIMASNKYQIERGVSYGKKKISMAMQIPILESFKGLRSAEIEALLYRFGIRHAEEETDTSPKDNEDLLRANTCVKTGQQYNG